MRRLSGTCCIAGGESEEVLDTIPLESVELFPDACGFPAKQPSTCANDWPSEAVQRPRFHETWPELPQSASGRQDAPGSVPAIRRIESGWQPSCWCWNRLSKIESWPVDVDQLRPQLGVAVPAPIDPTRPISRRWNRRTGLVSNRRN